MLLLTLVVTRRGWLAGVWLANVCAADKLTPADRLTFDVAPGSTLRCEILGMISSVKLAER